MSRVTDSPVSTVADRPLGWLLAICLPYLIYFYLIGTDLGESQALFVAVVSASICVHLRSPAVDQSFNWIQTWQQSKTSRWIR